MLTMSGERPWGFEAGVDVLRLCRGCCSDGSAAMYWVFSVMRPERTEAVKERWRV